MPRVRGVALGVSGWHIYLPLLLKAGVLLITYYATAYFGLTLEPVSGFATLVWPPTGIAVAALFLWGIELWPAVALGALLVNFVTGASVPVAAGIALGNTLEAVAGAYLLKGFGFSGRLTSVRDAFLFLIFGAHLNALVSATIGVASLWLGGVVPFVHISQTWTAWLTGDVLGSLVVGALLFNIRSVFPLQIQFDRKWWFKGLEFFSLLALCILFNLVIFTGVLPITYRNFLGAEHPVLILNYTLFPLLMWGAFRFRPLVPSLMVFVTAAIGIWGGVAGYGPFISDSLSNGLFLLQIFIGSLAVIGMVLAAAIEDRRRTNARLQASDRAKTEFISLTSHQLRTPLSTMKWYLEEFSTRSASTLSEMQQHYLAEMRRAITSMIELVDTFLNVSRVELDIFSIHPVSVRFSEIAHEVMAEFTPLAEQRQVQVVARHDENLPLVPADPALVRTVMQNLLSNSIKYSPSGSTVEFRLRKDMHDIILEVADRGYGIPRAQQEKVFSKSFRTEMARTLDPTGNGLGLYMVKSLVNTAGGSIWFISEENAGTTFFVSFPLTGMVTRQRV